MSKTYIIISIIVICIAIASIFFVTFTIGKMKGYGEGITNGVSLGYQECVNDYEKGYTNFLIFSLIDFCGTKEKEGIVGYYLENSLNETGFMCEYELPVLNDKNINYNEESYNEGYWNEQYVWSYSRVQEYHEFKELREVSK